MTAALASNGRARTTIRCGEKSPRRHARSQPDVATLTIRCEAWRPSATRRHCLHITNAYAVVYGWQSSCVSPEPGDRRGRTTMAVKEAPVRPHDRILTSPSTGQQTPESTAARIRELVSILRENRTELREEWARRITESRLLTAMTREEIFAEATTVYDNYVAVLETGSVQALQAYARDLSERIIPRGVETQEVLGIVLLLRDVLARSLFKKYQLNFDLLNQVLDAYEPAANRIANTVAVGFVQERERIIRQQQE